MNQVNIQPAALADMAEAAQWYERQLADLGIEFILELTPPLIGQRRHQKLIWSFFKVSVEF